jgi:hypothetical protein
MLRNGRNYGLGQEHIQERRYKTQVHKSDSRSRRKSWSFNMGQYVMLCVFGLKVVGS